MSSELRFVKWARFFERSCILKWVTFFASFCWLWDFLLENQKIRKNSDDVQWNVWTNINALHIRNNVFKKRILNIRFWIIYILVQISFFRTALGRFNQCFLSVFCRQPTLVADIFTQPPQTWKTFLRPCNMLIVWSFVHNLFQFGAMINRWMKQVLQL